MPGWLKYWESKLFSVPSSPPPQLIEMNLAPSVRAVSTAVYRLLDGSFASTSRMWQLGQVAETASRSSEISPAHPVSPWGSGLAWPFWLTLRKQPFAVVQADSPYWAR